MPSQKGPAPQPERRPCDGHSAFAAVQRCMPVCMNCRKAVEDSLTRVAGRRLRRMRAIPSCSIEKCAAFLRSVQDREMRFHLATMAWWRFSADGADGTTEPIRSVMANCNVGNPEFGTTYLHTALKALSKLTPEQLTVWFGCENLYQIAALFSGEIPDRLGPHCRKCRLFKMGCTAATLGRASDCTLWDDRWLQGIAETVAKDGWKDPCKNVKEA